MKKFLLLLITSVLLFSSCSMIKKDYWIVAKVIEDDDTHFIYITENNYYFITKQNKEISISYFLLPETKQSITIKNVKSFDNNVIEIKDIDYTNNIITCNVKNVGMSYIDIITDKNGSTTTPKIYCQTE